MRFVTSSIPTPTRTASWMILGENKDHRSIRIYHLNTKENCVISPEEKGIPSFGIRAGIAGRVGFDCLEY